MGYATRVRSLLVIIAGFLGIVLLLISLRCAAAPVAVGGYRLLK